MHYHKTLQMMTFRLIPKRFFIAATQVPTSLHSCDRAKALEWKIFIDFENIPTL